MRWLGSLLDFVLDVLVFDAKRKGNLIPREDDLEPVRQQVRNDLLNRGPCRCEDCRCGFNKPDPNKRPGG